MTWQTPEDNGGSTIAGFIVERRESRSNRWLRINKNPVTMTRYRSSGLIEGLEYDYRITAINSRGAGKPSEPSAATVAMDPIGTRKKKLKSPSVCLCVVCFCTAWLTLAPDVFL